MIIRSLACLLMFLVIRRYRATLIEMSEAELREKELDILTLDHEANAAGHKVALGILAGRH